MGRLAISLLQGLLIQYAVYGAEVDIDAYARAAVTMIDRPDPAHSYCNARSGSSFAARRAGVTAASRPATTETSTSTTS